MKLLKNTLCVMLTMVCLLLSFGCTPLKDLFPPHGNEILTLAEARDIVVDALKITNETPISLIYPTNHDFGLNNRNILSKLRTSKIDFYNDHNNFATHGLIERHNKNWVKFDTLCTDNYSRCYEYYNGTTVFQKYNDTYTTKDIDLCYFSSILCGMDCIFLDLLFIDEAWLTIYEDEVIKTEDDTKITLTFDINDPIFMDFATAEAKLLGFGTEGVFGEGDYLERNKANGSVSLSVNFDKQLKISGLNMHIYSLSSDGFINSYVNISKYDEPITEPSWFNIEDFA